jgi:hypothetical protein
MTKLVLSITEPGYRFLIFDEDGKRKMHASCGFATECSFPLWTSEKEIALRYLKDHYEPRVMRDLRGIEKTYPPLYDETMPEAMALKNRLENIFTKQRELEL